MAEEGKKSWSDRIGGVFAWGSVIVFGVIAAMVEEQLLKPPKEMRDTLVGVGIGAILGALILGVYALRLADAAYQAIVYLVMAFVFCVDCIVLYGLVRLWYFGLESWGLSLSTVRGWAWFGLFLQFVVNLGISALLIPVMRAAGIDPKEF